MDLSTLARKGGALSLGAKTSLGSPDALTSSVLVRNTSVEVLTISVVLLTTSIVVLTDSALVLTTGVVTLVF